MRDKAGPWNAGRSALSSAGPFGRRGQMTARDRQVWVIASSLFASLFLLWGSGYNTFPIFFPALLKYFGWSKAQMALISSGLSLSLGISAPFAGWVLDRIEARWVMGVGAALVVAGLVMASRADTFGQLLAGNVTLGVGLGASTVLPSALVISNCSASAAGWCLDWRLREWSSAGCA